MKHRKLAGVASLALAACMLLSACGGNTTASSTASSGGTSEPASSTASSETASSAAEATTQVFKATDPSKVPAAAKARKDTLVIGTADLAGKFQQIYAETVDDYHVSYAISGATLQNNDDKGNLTDGTASMKVSDDGLTYTFTLKYPDDKYSDGSPVKAEDYVNYFKVICDKSYDGPINPLFNYNVTGAQDYYDGKADTISGIKAVDDKTLEVKLDKPNSSAQYALGGAYPISTALYGKTIKHGDLKAFKAINMVGYVGNGSYTLAEYKQGQSATLKANPNYYAGAPKIPNIIIKVVAADQEMQAVITGSVDVEEEPVCNDDNIELGKQAGFISQQVDPTLGYGFIGVNNANPLFKDVKVRQALLYAIDRKSVVEAVYGKYGHVQNINQTAESWLYTEEGINTYDYDISKAADLLKQAGWTKDSSGKLTKDGQQFKFIFTAMKDNAVTDAMIPVMQDAYKQLGIDMQAEYVDWPTLSQKATDKKYDMYFMAWGLSTDPDDSYIYSTGGSQNNLNYSNKELDEAYKTALASTDKESRKTAYQKVYQIINQTLPCFIIYQRSDLIAYSSRLKTFQASPYVPTYQQYHLYELQ